MYVRCGVSVQGGMMETLYKQTKKKILSLGYEGDFPNQMNDEDDWLF